MMGSSSSSPKGLLRERRYPDHAGWERDAFGAGAHHDHGQGLKVRQGVHSPDHFQAVGNRHHEVGEHHVRVLLYQLRETILAVRRRHDVIARFLEKLGQALDEEAFIVDYEDGLHCYR